MGRAIRTSCIKLGMLEKMTSASSVGGPPSSNKPLKRTSRPLLEDLRQQISYGQGRRRGNAHHIGGRSLNDGDIGTLFVEIMSNTGKNVNADRLSHAWSTYSCPLLQQPTTIAFFPLYSEPVVCWLEWQILPLNFSWPLNVGTLISAGHLSMHDQITGKQTYLRCVQSQG